MRLIGRINHDTLNFYWVVDEVQFNNPTSHPRKKLKIIMSKHSIKEVTIKLDATNVGTF